MLPAQGTGHLRGGLSVEGLLVRDLQLPPTSRFAYFMRPLPARAEELTRHATRFRTRMLRVVNVSIARRRYSAPLIFGNPLCSLYPCCVRLAWNAAARLLYKISYLIPKHSSRCDGMQRLHAAVRDCLAMTGAPLTCHGTVRDTPAKGIRLNQANGYPVTL